MLRGQRRRQISSNGEPVREVKLVLIGDIGVGKSCIAYRFCDDVFHPSPQSTTGVGYRHNTMDVGDETILFNIWDTAGQEVYHSILPIYFRAVSAAIITYDITEQSSFDSLQYWMSELKKHLSCEAVLAIVGNKSDLKSLRQVSHDAGLRLAQRCGAIFLETSAKTGINVRQLFYKLGEQLTRQWKVQSPLAVSTLKLEFSMDGCEKKKKGCRIKHCLTKDPND